LDSAGLYGLQRSRKVGIGAISKGRRTVLTSAQIFINVGGRPRIPAFPGIDRVAFLTSTSLLELEELPAHLLIIGGSYVGLEFAYRRFGSEVTVIEKEPRLLSHEDPEVAAAIQTALDERVFKYGLGPNALNSLAILNR
jgi:pyruvate/2-oxoglutarate dehydrogenase complex dihydrolipoamide dehydrogenase (E3) component